MSSRCENFCGNLKSKPPNDARNAKKTWIFINIFFWKNMNFHQFLCKSFVNRPQKSGFLAYDSSWSSVHIFRSLFRSGFRKTHQNWSKTSEKWFILKNVYFLQFLCKSFVNWHLKNGFLTFDISWCPILYSRTHFAAGVRKTHQNWP